LGTHQHKGVEELFYVISGEGSTRINQEEPELGFYPTRCEEPSACGTHPRTPEAHPAAELPVRISVAHWKSGAAHARSL
jgi:oxalate decarboxylase/phosphoglucose isomerase-like protein (cupin superfamily)